MHPNNQCPHQPLISVLVPVYNAEATLERCITSVLNQTLQDFEIVLVNDGSADSSAALCNSYAEQDPRIRVIHQANGGVWAARNTALSHATGKYIAWIDNDDFVFPQWLESLYHLLLRYGTQISMCRFQDTDQTVLPAAPRPAIEPDCKMAFAEYAEALQGPREMEMTALWNKLYCAELWQDVQFVTGSFVDDGYVVWKLVYKAKEIAVSTVSLYMYYNAPTSVSRSDSYKLRGLHNVPCLEERYRFFAANGYTWPAGMTLRRCYENIALFTLWLADSAEEKAAKKTLKKAYLRLLPHGLASPFFGKKAKLYMLAALIFQKRFMPLFQAQVARTPPSTGTSSPA